MDSYSRSSVNCNGGSSMYMLDSDSLLVAHLASHLLDHWMAFLMRYITPYRNGNLKTDRNSCAFGYSNGTR